MNKTNRSLRILCIDDNPGDLELVQAALYASESCNFTIECAHTMRSGLEYLRARQFDAILLDLTLPDSRGLDTVSTVAQVRQTTPVIVLTGMQGDELALAALSRGADDYLTKNALDTVTATRAIAYAVERSRLAERLRQNEALLRQVQAIARLGCISWEAESNRMMWSEQMYEILGMDAHHMATHQRPVLEYILPEDRLRVATLIRDAMQADTNFEFECKALRADGNIVAIHGRFCIERGIDGKVIRVAGGCQDITERKHLEEQLAKLSLTDALTGLDNRRAATDRMELAIAEAGRGRACAFLMIDVDHFKAINDKWGHDVGDQALVAIAQTLKSRLRCTDMVARYGGEEFVVVLTDISLSGACEVAEDLRASVAMLQKPVPLTVSIGVAASGAPWPPSVAFILREADKALYRAKSEGRNRVIAANAGPSRILRVV